VALNQALGLGHLQTRRRPESGSALRGLLAVMMMSPTRCCHRGEPLLVLGSAPSPLANPWCQLSVVTLLTSGNRLGEFGAGMMFLVLGSACLSLL